MRWCYKTVHYELKKEGFLGSSFLDESEVEQSLNEYGQAGWELVSVTETQDGLIAIFKQPLQAEDVQPDVDQITTDTRRESEDEALITEEDVIDEQTPADDDGSENGLYKIRIE